MNTLLLEFWIEQDDFCIYAEAGDYEQERTLTGQARAIMAHCTTIYTILEELQTQRVQALEEAIRVLSEQLIAPFADQLRTCDLVRFVVYEELIRGAFDLLLFEGAYLFLQRPICYQVAEGEGEAQPALELESALLIADLTADPEQACKQVAQLFPEATYAKMQDADMAMINAAADQVDVLVISAHGELDEDNQGSLSLNDEVLRARLIEKLEAWIVYFDSCQQGVNMTYLTAFQEESDTQYYLAPIISNDAGDSSTKTMVWFFEAVKAHKNPLRALAETRQRLYEHYRMQRRLDLVTSLNKAYPFRLYEFVDSEEDV